MDQKTATISNERLEKYFSITKEALAKAKSAPCGTPCCSKRTEHAHTVLDMAQRYYDDALFFLKKGDAVTAFAALNYAHGWLDAGARLGLFQVTDSQLFTVDGV